MRSGETAERSGSTNTPTRTRRAFLATGGIIMAGSLVGCLGGGDGSDSTATPTEGTETSTPTETAEEVVIGSIHPFSGSTSYVGTRLHQAMDLAATIENEDGGIESLGGAEVRLVKGDHKNDPTTGGEVAQELIDDGADVLTGTYSSPVASSVARVAESNEVPFVIDIAADTAILQERDFTYTYRAQPNALSQSIDTVEGIASLTDQAGADISTAGLFFIDNTYGQAYRDGLTQAFTERGIDVVAKETITFGGTADTQVTKFREADPDVIVPTVYTNQMLTLVNAMTNQDYWPTLFAACASGGMNQTNFEKMGGVINGAFSAGYQIDLTSERIRQINQRYMDTYETPAMKGNVGMAYSTGEVIVETVKEAGSLDSDTLTETLDTISVSDHVMAMPPIEFDENHENANGLTVTNQVQDLQAEIVYPEEWATTELDAGAIGN